MDTILILQAAGSLAAFCALFYASWAALKSTEPEVAPDPPRESDLIVVDPGESSLEKDAEIRLRSQNVIGSDFDRADIPISDRSVAAEHAELAWKRGAWHLRRIDPHQHLAVNGAQVPDERALRTGDRVEVGRVTFRLRIW